MTPLIDTIESIMCTCVSQTLSGKRIYIIIQFATHTSANDPRVIIFGYYSSRPSFRVYLKDKI
jgi:hypothetical protein